MQASSIIEGHTDSKRAASYNLDLSYRRAATVLRVLTQDYGVSSSFLSIKGYGEQEPIASNTSAEGRALNRRVTLVSTR